MSQARNQANPEFSADKDREPQKPSLDELRASLVIERDNAIDAVNRSIRMAGLIDGMSEDIKSGLIQSLEAALRELDDIDPATIADAEALLDAAQRIKSISLGKSWSA